MTRFLLATAGLLILSGCSADGPARRSYLSEAGAVLDHGSLGRATLNNHLVMTGQRGHIIDLSHRFAREVTSTVTFAFNSAQLDGTARAVLHEQASWIRQFPEIRFRVYGHTDLVGSNAYNKRLGLRRARAVVGYLASLGISQSRLEAVVSYGETQPLIVTQGRERRNRRTVTEVLGFVGSHPIVMQGKYAEVVYREYIESAVPKSTLTTLTKSDIPAAAE